MNIIKELSWRGLLKQVTNEEKLLKSQELQKGVYCGFDPTGDSLHVGHLIQIILLERFAKCGFKPIAIIGGGTGMIGDPSGKKAERILLNNAIVLHNVERIKQQVEKLIPNVQIVNNGEWLNKISLIDFLRDVGKDFNISYLLNKENIASRIESGLSYTEFSYTLLQAYDFYRLYEKYDCTVQTGGSDQWGNITSGTDYIRKQLGEDNLACGLTMNLLTKADGTKFGKTESGAVWLDPEKTSPYEFYQFFYNQEDIETFKLLKFLTFLSEAEIKQLEQDHLKEPFKRLGQKKLAAELTLFVHGKDELARAIKISGALFNGNLHELSLSELESIQHSLPHYQLESLNLNLLDLLVASEVVSSKREGREFLSQNAITINGQVVNDETKVLASADFLHNKFLIIRRGKRKYHIIYL
ncbi:tyrosine--tRNA ligase [Spiroplasma eriocheiris]|uniref:Tyrosine--tRNA ligase n=1 Tax=Spiroplasma eriocheiris TaxID=315358 RepID=A0A0H3XN85_9MOLU|nr:tyrosine--tRNA ligase [Spiroplasma eriocheiris]AHF58207.1 tyrosyl-tRNA synthetase [Spiroplasma eriocheiris CCTCC M 207170]AKM54642.1 tyrosyl-tRNA synthetase [Spiroplasma eriocheiris]